MSRDGADVPSPIDFHDLAQARAWEEDTVRRKPWRPRFFAGIAAAIRGRPGQAELIELGSGPGHLAEHLLHECEFVRYVALDYSAAMHALARQRLAGLATRVSFKRRDFRAPGWTAALGTFDVAVSMQSAHEVRHKTRIPTLFASVRGLLEPGGLFLYCDSYGAPGSTLDLELHLTAGEQPRLLGDAGFTDVTLLHDEGGMALYRATAPG